MNSSSNVIDASQLLRNSCIKGIRYIIDESFGSTNNEFNTSWIEVEVYDELHENIALHKAVTANFKPMMDVTGQSDLSTITNGQVTQREWVSCNISLEKYLPAKIIIDLGKEYTNISKIYLYHGWWTERSYKNRVYVAQKLTKPICVYDYKIHGPVYESVGKPLIIKLR